MTLDLGIILIAKTTYLVNLNTTLHQLSDYLCLTSSCLCLTSYKIYYLAIRHLSHNAQ